MENIEEKKADIERQAKEREQKEILISHSILRSMILTKCLREENAFVRSFNLKLPPFNHVLSRMGDCIDKGLMDIKTTIRSNEILVKPFDVTTSKEDVEIICELLSEIMFEQNKAQFLNLIKEVKAGNVKFEIVTKQEQDA